MSDPLAGGVDGYRDVELVSKFLNITARRVQQLAAEGHIPRAERGKYHLVGAIRGYLKFLQERVDGRGDDERQKLTRLQAEDLELRLAERRGRLVDVEQYEAGVARMAIAFREQLLSRDDALKAELDAMYGIDVDVGLLNEHTYASLSQLSGYDPSGDRIAAPGGQQAGAAGADDDDGLGDGTSSPLAEGDGAAG